MVSCLGLLFILLLNFKWREDQYIAQHQFTPVAEWTWSPISNIGIVSRLLRITFIKRKHAAAAAASFCPSAAGCRAVSSTYLWAIAGHFRRFHCWQGRLSWCQKEAVSWPWQKPVQIRMMHPTHLWDNCEACVQLWLGLNLDHRGHLISPFFLTYQVLAALQKNIEKNRESGWSIVTQATRPSSWYHTGSGVGFGIELWEDLLVV